jgi:hypothetical protein
VRPKKRTSAVRSANPAYQGAGGGSGVPGVLAMTDEQQHGTRSGIGRLGWRIGERERIGNCEWLSESSQRWRSVNGGQDRYQIRRRV